MLSTLRFVKRIAFRSVETVPDRLDALQAIIHHSLLDHSHRSAIFKSSHRLWEIRERNLKPSLRPGSHHQGSLVTHDIGAHVVEFPAHIRDIIIFHHALQCLLNVILVSKIAQAADVRHVLADKLVHKAAFAKLERRDLVRVFRKELEGLRICDLVLVILAVEKVGVHPGAAFLKKAPAFLGKFLVFHRLGHLLSRPQSSHVPEPHLGIRTEVVDIHGVMLRAFHDSILVTIPTFFLPGKREGTLTGRPIFTEESFVTA